jgi:hypothetical protein
MAEAMSVSVHQMRMAPIIAAALMLSACGSVIPPPPRATFTPATPRPAQQTQVLPTERSTNGIIGADARALIRLLGEPRLDIRDPEVRKLQFGNGRCVVDAYLYPRGARSDPVVTYAEARTIDGTSMDVSACVDRLKAR